MKKILIVDDERQNLYLLHALLSARGYAVHQASNGAEALAQARQTPPDAIISDILMPVMDGFALCRAWREDEQLRAIPFIFYTATYTDASDEAFALSLGADRFLVKPMEPVDLLKALTETLDSYRQGNPHPMPSEPVAESEYYQEYNATLIRKLESKMRQLEEVNQDLSEDIARRVQAEEEREHLLKRVKAQANQIARIIDTVPQGVLLLGEDGVILLTNPTAENQLPLLTAANMGDPLTHLGDLPLAHLLEEGRQGKGWHEIQIGSRVFEAIARPTNGEGPDQWVLLINDVTEAWDMRRQLEQQERLAALGQLVAGISHDFNNILAVISLQLSMLADTAPMSEADRQRFAVIQGQTVHATHLIQQLLDFSRRAVLERRPLDLAEFLMDQVKLLKRTLPESIQITLNCDSQRYVVMADATRMQQMIMNLAFNARDAMPQGGEMRLQLQSAAPDNQPQHAHNRWIRLDISDTGSGISPQDQAHIFEPFFTTKPLSKGTGLGLAQVHGIVKQHEGEITVHSEPGRGTTFTIYLPKLSTSITPPSEPVPIAQTGDGELILIVEDNPVLLDALCDIIEVFGYRALAASNGADALAQLEAHPGQIALVLSDLSMPVMGGDRLLAAMRQQGIDIPFVILSGYPLGEELAALRAHGLSNWLIKPPDVDELHNVLIKALNSTA